MSGAEVYVVGQTWFDWASAEDFTEGRWDSNGRGDAESLIEFAGRACYQSWGKPNPLTAEREAYIANLLSQGHFSVLEHGTVTVALKRISRSLTHELVRHRHFSYSQLSQRYVKPGTQQPVIPPLLRGDEQAETILEAVWEECAKAYDKLVDYALGKQLGDDMKASFTANKRAREAARAVLPNMAPTQIVMTGNHRSWLEFFAKRGSVHADAEIRALTHVIFEIFEAQFPEIYREWEAVEKEISWNAHNEPTEWTYVIQRRESVASGQEAHTEGTMMKVRDALLEAGLPDDEVMTAINSLQNAGILFRERS